MVHRQQIERGQLLEENSSLIKLLKKAKKRGYIPSTFHQIFYDGGNACLYMEEKRKNMPEATIVSRHNPDKFYYQLYQID